MSEFGELLEDGTLRFTRYLPGPIDRVWTWLIDPEKRKEWLAGGAMPTKAGETFTLFFDNSQLTPHDDQPPEKYECMQISSFECEMLVFDPPHHLSFSWPDRDDRMGEVTVHLTEDQGKVKLVLTHKGISMRDEIIGASGGWHVHIDIMTEKLLGQIPDPFWTRHMDMEEHYAERHADILKRLGL